MNESSGMAAELAAAGFEDAEEIERSGGGVPYRCVQSSVGRAVAVKVLTAELDEQNRARFVREQRALGRLTGHPNVVAVLQSGQTSTGYRYLVTPYHHHSLEKRIAAGGPLPVEPTLTLGAKMAGALETVHQRGIVHRAVEPANIVFTDCGEPALAGFGIAHIAGGYTTTTGTIAGTPAFTAPEVLAGDPPTPGSDVYGLGATLFCALTGHAAFERRRGEQVLTQFLRITAEPAPDLRDHGIPEAVCAVVETMMSPDPRERPSAAALGEQLQRIHGHNLAADTDTKVVRGGERRQSARPGHGRLPAELTSFVGRRGELVEARRALSVSRLVTLTGIGGVGKTRLALRVTRSVRRRFPGGVWLVELGALSNPDAVADRVAAAVGVRDHTSTPLREVLVDALAPRTALLVLDNCEHVIDATAELVRALLPRCPSLRILATSREVLGLGGEMVVQVLPLTTPSPAQTGPSARCDAVALFLDRAAAAVPGLDLTEPTTPIIAQICTRLEGLPLAIELAGARLRTLGPEQILERLTDRYALLTGGDRSALPRQQTLTWCVGWSYELCTPAEQQMCARLSLFAGGMDLDAAEYVCGDTDIPDVLDTLTSLVDKSILIREEVDREVRFRLLETVREYGQQRFEDTDRYRALRRRHREWYRRLAINADAGWIGPHQLEWAARVARELPNLRGAFEFALTEENGSALQIAAALGPFWLSHGLLGKGRRWLDAALDRPGTQPAVLRAKATYAVCMLATAGLNSP